MSVETPHQCATGLGKRRSREMFLTSLRQGSACVRLSGTPQKNSQSFAKMFGQIEWIALCL